MEIIGLGVMIGKVQAIFKFRKVSLSKKDIGIGNGIVHNTVRVGSINDFKAKMDIHLESIQLDMLAEQQDAPAERQQDNQIDTGSFQQ